MGLRIAVFGQAAFGRDVLLQLLAAGHEVVGVFVPPDRGRPDPLAEEAERQRLVLHRQRHFRRAGRAIPERVEEVRRLGAELHVLPYTTVILPPEILDQPRHGSLCFHPSLLPRYRGGAALAWQIILGEKETGVTVFRPDEGIDTGPVVVQRGGVVIDDADTAGTLYFQKLYPLGVEAVVEAVAQVANGTATYTPQGQAGASFQGLVDDEVARIDWSRDARELDRLIRGCDPQPGAHARLGEQTLRLFESRLDATPTPAAPGTLVGFEDGRARIAARGGALLIGRVRLGQGPKRPAADAELRPGARLA